MQDRGVHITRNAVMGWFQQRDGSWTRAAQGLKKPLDDPASFEQFYNSQLTGTTPRHEQQPGTTGLADWRPSPFFDRRQQRTPSDTNVTLATGSEGSVVGATTTPSRARDVTPQQTITPRTRHTADSDVHSWVAKLEARAAAHVSEVYK